MDCRLISRWHWGFRYEGTWFNPTVKRNLVWNECKQASAIAAQVKKKATASISSSGTDSSDGDEDPNARRGLLNFLYAFNQTVKSQTSEFRKRYRSNIPMYRQASGVMCVTSFTSNGVNNTKKMRKEHEKRTFSMYPLREVVTVFNPTVNHNDSRPGRTRP